MTNIHIITPPNIIGLHRYVDVDQRSQHQHRGWVPHLKLLIHSPPNIIDPRRCEDVEKNANISIVEGNRTSKNPQTITPIVLIIIYLLFSFTELYKSCVCLLSFLTCNACHRRSKGIQPSFSDVCQRRGSDVRWKLEFVSFHILFHSSQTDLSVNSIYHS